MSVETSPYCFLNVFTAAKLLPLEKFLCLLLHIKVTRVHVHEIWSYTLIQDHGPLTPALETD